MTDLAKYARTRAERDPQFAEGLEVGYEDLKIEALIWQARENEGLTREEADDWLDTKKPAGSE